MDRRELLGILAGSALAVPGCLAGQSDEAGGPPSATPTETPTAPSGTPTGTGPETRTEASGAFVDETFVVPELAAPNSPDSFGVYGDRDEQFVVALLSGGPTRAPPVDDIALVAGGERYSATTDVSNQRWGLFDHGTPYLPDRDALDGWVVFRLPNPLDAEDARIDWPGGESALGDDAVATLTRPPTSFAVGPLEAPAAVPTDGSFRLSLTVENTGDTDGTFVGAMNRNFPAYEPVATIRLPVAAGETATWERSVEAATMGNSGGELRLWLYWREDSADRQVTVDVGSGTADGTPEGATEPPTTRTATADPTAASGHRPR